MLEGVQSILEIDIQTKSIKDAIDPLVNQVSILSMLSNRKKGARSRRVLAHAKNINVVCYELVKVAREVAKEHPDVEYELNRACNHTQEILNVMKMKIETDHDKKDTTIVDIAKQLVNHVVYVLVVTDSADLILLNKTVQQVEQCLRAVEECSAISVFGEIFHRLQDIMDIFMKQVAQRQMDLIDQRKKDDLASVRAIWMRCKNRLYTSSRVVIVHPELESGQENRRLVLEEIRESLKKLQLTLNDRCLDRHDKAGKLASNFEIFDLNVAFAHNLGKEQQEALQNQLLLIIQESTTIAESGSTRDERRESIMGLCEECRQSLHILTQGRLSSVEKDKLIEKICKDTQTLRHYLKLATLDHIDDFYFLPHIPFQVLYNVATESKCDWNQFRESEHEMIEHALNLEVIARMACSLSLESYHTKVVRTAIAHHVSLFKQVIYATRSLANQCKSEYIQLNMEVYKRAWHKQLTTLIEAVDEICPAEEFLYISECHVKEDVQQINMILSAESHYQNKDNGEKDTNWADNGEKDTNWADLDQTVDALVNRTYRVLSVVKEEIRKSLDERRMQTDPLMQKLHNRVPKLLQDVKKTCNDLVSLGRNKTPQLTGNVFEVAKQLGEIRLDFSKVNTRCDAYIDSFKAEYETSLHELNKMSMSSQHSTILSTLFDITHLMNNIVSSIEHINCVEQWPATVQKIRLLNSSVCNLDYQIRDIISNCRNPDLRNDFSNYANKIRDNANKTLHYAMTDMSGYVCYGDIFLKILSSFKSIVTFVPLIYKAYHASHGKRKKSSKKKHNLM